MLMRSIIYHLALLGTTSNNKENGGQIATTGIDEERPWDGVGCLKAGASSHLLEGWREGGMDGAAVPAATRSVPLSVSGGPSPPERHRLSRGWTRAGGS